MVLAIVKRKINTKLRDVILSKYRTQADFAYMLGWNEGKVSRIVNGRLKPTQEDKRVMAWKLQVKISDIFPES